MSMTVETVKLIEEEKRRTELNRNIYQEMDFAHQSQKLIDRKKKTKRSKLYFLLVNVRF